MQSHIVPASVEVLRRTVLARLSATVPHAKEAANGEGTNKHDKHDNGHRNGRRQVDVRPGFRRREQRPGRRREDRL